LLRFVPEPVGFCAVLQDLRGATAALASSPFLAELRKAPFLQGLTGGDELAQLQQVRTLLEKQLGLTLEQVRDDILGDAVVFAYRPGPPGKPEQDQGLLMLRARSAEALARLIEQLNKLARGLGDDKGVEERTHQGITYFARREKRRVSYYYLRGPILLVTEQEDFLRQALDHERALPADARPAMVQRLERLGIAADLFGVWINPRAWDPELQAKLAQPQQANAAVLRNFAAYWKALDGVGLSLRLDRDLTLSVALQARLTALPAPAQRFFTQAGEPSPLWQAFPADALFAVGGRFDAGSLLAALGDFLPKDARQTLEKELNRSLGAAMDKDFVKDVLPQVGPEWGLCVVAPPAQGKGWLPAGVLAVRLRPGDPAAPVDQAVFNALESFAQVAVFSHNRVNPEHLLALKRTTQDGQPVRYLVGDGVFPPGVQPAFSLQRGYLLLASAPEALRRVASALAAPALTPGGFQPLLRVSFKEIRRYLSDHQKPVAKFVAEKNQLPEAEARARLQGVLAGLEFLDSLELRQQPGDGRTVLQLVLRPAQPLGK
jgi:hypothetical protein